MSSITKTTNLLKLLADPTRFRIMRLLLSSPEGMCVNDLAREVEVSQSAVSHQLSKLEAHALVQCFREGRTACYQIVPGPLAHKLEGILRAAM